MSSSKISGRTQACAVRVAVPRTAITAQLTASASVIKMIPRASASARFPLEVSSAIVVVIRASPGDIVADDDHRADLGDGPPKPARATVSRL